MQSAGTLPLEGAQTALAFHHCQPSPCNCGSCISLGMLQFWGPDLKLTAKVTPRGEDLPLQRLPAATGGAAGEGRGAGGWHSVLEPGSRSPGWARPTPGHCGTLPKQRGRDRSQHRAAGSLCAPESWGTWHHPSPPFSQGGLGLTALCTQSFIWNSFVLSSLPLCLLDEICETQAEV